MNCTICNKPVVLNPSAEERARKYMDHMLDPEILSQDGGCSASDQEEVIDMVMRAKGVLELILGRRIALDNQE